MRFLTLAEVVELHDLVPLDRAHGDPQAQPPSPTSSCRPAGGTGTSMDRRHVAVAAVAGVGPRVPQDAREEALPAQRATESPESNGEVCGSHHPQDGDHAENSAVLDSERPRQQGERCHHGQIQNPRKSDRAPAAVKLSPPVRGRRGLRRRALLPAQPITCSRWICGAPAISPLNDGPDALKCALWPWAASAASSL